MAFCGYLRQSTAVDILLGPFLEDGDADTPTTGLTIDVEISKNGQPLADSESGAPTHDAAGTVDGYYNCVLGTTDTATLGILTVVAHHADALAIRQDYQIVTANWFDSMCSTDNLDVNVTAMAANVVTAAAINADAITSAKIADNALANEHFAAGALTATEITGAAGCAVTSIGNDVITPASVDEDADFVIQALSITNALDAGSVLVDGTTTLTGNVSCGAGFDVVGAMSANSLLIDTTTTLTGAVSCGSTFDVVGELSANSVLVDAGMDIVGALSANSLLIDTTATVTGNALISGTTTHTGITTYTGAVNANITGDITGNVSGSVGTCAAATVSAIDNIDFGATMKASINTEVLDVLNTDTFAEPGDEAPTSTTTLVDKIGYLYKFLRNKIETTATKINVYDDAGANIDHTSTISDDDTTFTRGEFGAGE